MKMIVDLAKKKGWGEDPATKIYYGMIELGEAGDAWKHRANHEYLERSLGITSDEELRLHIAKELIDAILYCLHGIHYIDPNISADEIFLLKMKENEERSRVYIDDTIKP